MALYPPCPVGLAELILANCANGRLDHLSLSRCSSGQWNGMWQASFKRPGTSAYKVHIADTAEEVLVRVLGPDVGHAWSEILGPEYAVEDDDDDDNLEDLI